MSRVKKVVIELADIASIEQLHQRLQEELGLPHSYGKNWNAFWDCITNLVEMPLVLQLSGWHHLKAALPNDARVLRECLTDMQREYPYAAPHLIYTDSTERKP